MTSKKQLVAVKGNDYYDFMPVDATDAPHTQLYIHKSVNDETKPNYVISHKHSGWALFNAPLHANKKSVIAAAQHLWASLPIVLKDLLADTEYSGKQIQTEYKKLCKSNPQLKQSLARAFASTRMYLESQL